MHDLCTSEEPANNARLYIKSESFTTDDIKVEVSGNLKKQSVYRGVRVRALTSSPLFVDGGWPRAILVLLVQPTAKLAASYCKDNLPNVLSVLKLCFFSPFSHARRRSRDRPQSFGGVGVRWWF